MSFFNILNVDSASTDENNSIVEDIDLHIDENESEDENDFRGDPAEENQPTHAAITSKANKNTVLYLKSLHIKNMQYVKITF